MADKTMHHVVIGDDTFELIDEAGREETTALKEDFDDLKSAITHQYDFANKGNAKPGAKIYDDETIGGDATKHRWFDVELNDVKGLSHWYIDIENKTQYYMLMYFVSRDSAGQKIAATSGWKLVQNGTDLLTFMTESFLNGASKVSITYIFSSTTSTANVISGIGDLNYNFWLSGRLYAETKEINEIEEHKLENRYQVFQYTLGDGRNTGGWFAYPDMILEAGERHIISFTSIVFSGSIAFCNSEMEVDAVYSVTNDSIIEYTPSEDVFPVMFSIPYETGTGLPTTKLYRSTDALSVGDTITLDPSWSYDIFSFGIKIEKMYSLNEIIDSIPSALSNRVVYVDINGSGKYTSVVDAVANEPEGTVIYIMPGVYDGTVEAFLKRIILIGTDRNKCIIRSTDGRYDYPAINGSCGYIENLTLYSQYVSGESHEIDAQTSGAYAFHCENEYGKGKELEFHHCTLISDFCPGLGAGLRKDFNLILDDCILENRQIANRGVYTDVGSLGALYFHDSNGEQGNSHVLVKNCILKSSLGKTMTPYQVTRETQNNHVYCSFVCNVLYDKVNGYANNIWNRGDPFNPSTGIFSIELGFGNSNTALNNN